MPSSESRPSNLALLGKVAAICAVVLLVIALLLPLQRSATGAARRNACINSLREITLAMLNYEAEHGTLPPAYTVDENGNRLHSWRTLILPYLEEIPLYQSIDLSKPWDDPQNAPAAAAHPSCYLCAGSTHDIGLTTYQAVVGPDCVFTGSDPRQLSEVTDDLDGTIAVIDVSSDQAVHWMSPHDADTETFLAFTDDSTMNHTGVIGAALLDGRAIMIPLSSEPAVRRALLTVAGGEQPFEW